MWLPWMVTVLLSTPIILTSSEEANAVSTAKTEAHTLLNQGISKNEVPKAIEILLRMESKFVTENTTAPAPTPRWYMWLLFAGGIAVFIAGLRPRLIIGIGRGAQKLDAARLWLKFVSVILPGLIFAIILVPYLSRLLMGQ